MHLSEQSGMSLAEISHRCEVEKEVVRGFMTYWIAKGVVREKRFHATEHGADDINQGKNILYVIIEEQMENAIKDEEEIIAGNSTGGGGGNRNDTIEVSRKSDYVSTYLLNLSLSFLSHQFKTMSVVYPNLHYLHYPRSQIISVNYNHIARNYYILHEISILQIPLFYYLFNFLSYNFPSFSPRMPLVLVHLQRL